MKALQAGRCIHVDLLSGTALRLLALRRSESLLPIGETISHYRVVEKLGGGGVGVVYKARDTPFIALWRLNFFRAKRPKFPRPRSRFQREAQAASALNHPNICTIYDIGEQERLPGISLLVVLNGEQQAFIAMESLDGVTLKHRITGRPLETLAASRTSYSG